MPNKMEHLGHLWRSLTQVETKMHLRSNYQTTSTWKPLVSCWDARCPLRPSQGPRQSAWDLFWHPCSTPHDVTANLNSAFSSAKWQNGSQSFPFFNCSLSPSPDHEFGSRFCLITEKQRGGNHAHSRACRLEGTKKCWRKRQDIKQGDRGSLAMAILCNLVAGTVHWTEIHSLAQDAWVCMEVARHP